MPDEYRSQWVTFDEANEAVKLYNYDGIGLILIPSIGGIDIDHKSTDSALAKDINALK